MHISSSNAPNQNSPEYLDKIKCKLLENLRMIPHVPSVQMQTIPDDAMNVDEIDSEKMDASEDAAADKRGGGRVQKDKRTGDDEESADEDDAMNGGGAGEKRKNSENYKNLITKKRLNDNADQKVLKLT